MAVKAPVHAYPKLGDARGRRRLWLEGRKLEKFGIEKGHRYSVIWDRETRTVTLDFASGDGDRKVSGRSRHGRDMPIIDIAASELEETLGEGIARAKVTIHAGRIVVEVHPDDEAAQERLDRLVGKLNSGEPLLTGSLAHGGGILDHALHTGLKDAGIEARLAFAVEIDDRTLEAAATNNPIWDENTLQIQGGMEEVEVGLLPRSTFWSRGCPAPARRRPARRRTTMPRRKTIRAPAPSSSRSSTSSVTPSRPSSSWRTSRITPRAFRRS
jgi:DNA (cytosine-5)-methyltransferase 1